MFLLGYDIGSSSVKAALVSVESGEALSVVQSPDVEMDILSSHPDWAEQHPETWWENVGLATKRLLQNTKVDPSQIQGIGIAYQMHGLVLVDKAQRVLRPAIIWCDSRAVDIGAAAFSNIGEERCLLHLLNSPGNFTASKLKWIKENEPDIFEQIHKIMLPGDYLAMRLTGEIRTTINGLSEGIFWDFRENAPAELLLDYYGLSQDLLPDLVQTFAHQGTVSQSAAEATGLRAGIPVNYRAGDQPNNALSLDVLEPGEVAATGGTSGVVYGIVDRLLFDPESRVNGFAHVNHRAEYPRIGVLLCINGSGIQYSWIKKQMGKENLTYPEMEKAAATVGPGAEGLRILPFGNGAERMFGNRVPGARVNNLHFNRHKKAHFFRASLEGIAFSFVYGMNILSELGLDLRVIRVGNDNLFQSAIFSQTIANLIGSKIEVVETTGAIGAAKAAGVANGLYASIREAMHNNKIVNIFEPISQNGRYSEAYDVWLEDLDQLLNLSHRATQGVANLGPN